MLDTPLADEDAARHTLDRTQGIDRLEAMGGGSAIPIVALCLAETKNLSLSLSLRARRAVACRCR